MKGLDRVYLCGRHGREIKLTAIMKILMKIIIKPRWLYFSFRFEYQGALFCEHLHLERFSRAGVSRASLKNFHQKLCWAQSPTYSKPFCECCGKGGEGFLLCHHDKGVEMAAMSALNHGT